MNWWKEKRTMIDRAKSTLFFYKASTLSIGGWPAGMFERSEFSGLAFFVSFWGNAKKKGKKKLEFLVDLEYPMVCNKLSGPS